MIDLQIYLCEIRLMQERRRKISVLYNILLLIDYICSSSRQVDMSIKKMSYPNGCISGYLGCTFLKVSVSTVRKLCLELYKEGRQKIVLLQGFYSRGLVFQDFDH